MTTIEVRLAEPEFRLNPYPVYARLRAESPFARALLPGKRTAWLITRYDDVLSALKDERLGKDPSRVGRKQPWTPPALTPLTRNMLDLDPPDHTRLRAIVQKAFTPRVVEQLRPRIEQIASDLLDALGPKGTMDVIRDYAVPLTTTMIAEMLGVPTADRERFHRWSSRITAADSSNWAALRALPNAFAFVRYIRRLMEEKRRAPSDDLISAMIAAEDGGQKLSSDEVLAMTFLLLVAGHETTVNLIGNGMLALLENPGELHRVRTDPKLVPTAVEELLRYEGPLALATERYALEDIEVPGAVIRRAEQVFAVLGSANRDETQFPNADQVDVGRAPNRHLAFGHGAHYCLGAPLARLEGQIGISSLLGRFPTLSLDVPRRQLKLREGLVLRGVTSLPVSFEIA